MSKVAKAAVLWGINQRFQVEEVVWDDVGDDEIGVKLVACGACHSDWYQVDGSQKVKYPIVCGHEGAGVVVEVGKNVKDFEVGDHVITSWISCCGKCKWCYQGKGHLCDLGANLMVGTRRDGTYRIHTKDGKDVVQFAGLGAFSEYIVVPEQGGAIKIPKDLDLKKVTILGCRIPTGVGAVLWAAKAEQGCTALVIGCGCVGHNVIQALKGVNATIIIAADIYANKEKWAREFGATHFIDASKQDIVEEVMKITGIGVDYAFDAKGGALTQSQACAAIHKDGEAIWVGAASMDQPSVDLNAWKVTLWNQRIIGTCYGGKGPFEAVPKLIEMWRAGKIKFEELCTRQYKLEEINEAYADMFGGKNIAGIIVMD